MLDFEVIKSDDERAGDSVSTEDYDELYNKLREIRDDELILVPIPPQAMFKDFSQRVRCAIRHRAAKHGWFVSIRVVLVHNRKLAISIRATHKSNHPAWIRNRRAGQARGRKK